MTYYRHTQPARIVTGRINSIDTYASCADCGEPDAIIAGHLRDECGQLELVGFDTVPRVAGATYRPAYFCEKCFGARVGEGTEL